MIGFLLSLSAIVGSQSAPKSVWNMPVKAISSPVFKEEELAAIVGDLGIVAGKKLSIERIEAKIRQWHERLLVESLVVEASVVDGYLDVVLRGSRKRRLRAVRFKNTDSETQADVRSRFGLTDGSRIDSRTLGAASEYIAELLKAQGYYQGGVTVAVTDVAKTDESEVEFVVRLGEPTRIRNIEVLGATPEDTGEIRKLLEVRRGAVLKKKEMERTVEKIIGYLRDNQYPMAKPPDIAPTFLDTSVDLTIRVDTGRRIQIEFVGNTILDDIALREMLSSSTVSDEDSRRQITSAIQTRYRTLGFHFCKVKVDDEEKADILVRRISVDEGSKVLVDKLHVVGLSQSLDGDVVERVFFENAPGVLSRRVYWEEGLDEARRGLESALVNMGFSKARVNSVKPVFDGDGRGVQLFLEIETGVKRIVDQIFITGNTYLSEAKILVILGITPKTAHGPQRAGTAQAALLKHYQEYGFLDAQVSITETEVQDINQALVTLSVEINEGIQYRVGDLTVSGNTRTDDRVILREMKLSSGDVFAPSRLRSSEEDIGLLGIFSKVEITPHSSLTDPRKKDIKIVVTESRPGLGEVGVGAAYEDPRFRIRPFLGLAYRNLFGKNHTVSFRGELIFPISRDSFVPFLEYATVVGLRSPYPFELPFVFNAQIGIDRFESQSQTNDPASKSKGPILINRARLEERIERKVSTVTTLYYRLHRYERSVTQDLSLPSTNPVDVIGSTGPGLIIDLRDNVFNPTKGSYHTFDLEYANPALLSSDTIHFAMATARNSFYFPFIASTFLRFFVGLGYARTMDPDLSVPKVRLINEMALGGYQSIRGFSLRQFTPDENAKDSAYYNVRSEFAFPIFGDFGGAVFLDSGEIFPNLGFPESRSMSKGRQDGVGIGFRYKTPVGPFVIDFAHGLGSSAEGLQFYFTLGTI